MHLKLINDGIGFFFSNLVIGFECISKKKDFLNKRDIS
jgi:hypothetical protein